jgi:hypothetical protein
VKSAIQVAAALGSTLILCAAIVFVASFRSTSIAIGAVASGSPAVGATPISSAAAASADPSAIPSDSLGPIPTPSATAPAPTISPGPSSAILTSRFTVVMDSGKSVAIGGPSDCAQVADVWLTNWCSQLAAYDPSKLPTTASALANLQGTSWAKFDQQVQVAVAWAVLHNDDSICNNQAVTTWFAVGSRVADGSMTCRDDLATTIQKGSFSVTDYDTNKNLTVHLTSLLP